MTVLLALDPGKTTGYAQYETDGHGWSAGELTVEETWMHVSTTLAAAKDRQEAVQLISESFVITVNTAKNSQASWSLELIGVFRFLTWEYGYPAPVMQTPQVAKAFGTNDKLRLMGWWTPGKGGHANDASRHLLTYCATRQPYAETIIGKERLMEMAQA